MLGDIVKSVTDEKLFILFLLWFE